MWIQPDIQLTDQQDPGFKVLFGNQQLWPPLPPAEPYDSLETYDPVMEPCGAFTVQNGRLHYIHGSKSLKGYIWWEPQLGTYDNYHLLQMSMAVTIAFPFSGCQLLTPLKEGQLPPDQYKRTCVLLRPPLKSHYESLQLSHQKRQLSSEFDKLDLQLESFRLDDKSPLPISDLHLAAHSPNATRAGPSSPLSPSIPSPVHPVLLTHLVHPSSLRPLLGSSTIIRDSPSEQGRTGTPKIAAILAKPALGILNAAGGYLLRHVTAESAHTFAQFAKEQAHYRVLSPFLLKNLNKQKSPAKFINQLRNKLPRNLTIQEDQNIILVRALQATDQLNPELVISDLHYKHGLQILARNLHFLQQSLQILDQNAVEAGLSLLSAHQITINPEGPAFVELSKSGSFLVLNYFLTTTSTKVQTQYEFVPLPAYTAEIPSSVLTIDLPEYHALLPWPTRSNLSMLQSACADYILSAQYETQGQLSETACQFLSIPLPMAKVLMTLPAGKLIQTAKLSNDKLQFFLSCLYSPAQRFISSHSINIMFLPKDCSLRISAKSKMITYKTVDPVAQDAPFTFLLAYDIDFKPLTLTRAQKFEAMIASFISTLCLLTILLVYVVIRFRQKIHQLLSSPSQPAATFMHEPSPQYEAPFSPVRTTPLPVRTAPRAHSPVSRDYHAPSTASTYTDDRHSSASLESVIPLHQSYKHGYPRIPLVPAQPSAPAPAQLTRMESTI